MTFEWNENKNSINKRKPGVDFWEASSVFYDDNAIMFDDPITQMMKRDICKKGNKNGI